MGEDKGERRGASGGGRGFSLGWNHHPGLKTGDNHCLKTVAGRPPLVSVGNTNLDKRVGGVCEHFRPHRWKAFSPGSKVDPGLKGRTNASVSTSVLSYWVACTNQFIPKA
jgi:hypothetical protein